MYFMGKRGKKEKKKPTKHQSNRTRENPVVWTCKLVHILTEKQKGVTVSADCSRTREEMQRSKRSFLSLR